MKILASADFSDVRAAIKEAGRQGEFAAVVALNKTAKIIKEDLRSEMRRVFDRPTPFTLNSLRTKSATKAIPAAYVWLKDEAGKGTPADAYLAPQIFGGDRARKRMEKALQSAGLMPARWYAVPAAGAQLNSYGNVKSSQVVQILSQLMVQRGGGYQSKRSGSAASKRTVRRQGVTYFSIPERMGKLRPGIYLKRQFAHGSAIRPVFLYVPAVRYRQRFDFFGVADRSAERNFPRIFDQELDKTIKTAFLRNQGRLF